MSGLLAATPTLSPLDDRFLQLIDLPAPSAWVVIVGLILALVVGAVHALAPGHGKAIAAAYLIGAHGRPRDAWLLGAAVAAMHSASVLILGLGLQALATSGSRMDTVGPWLALASGLVILAVGVGSLRRVYRQHHSPVTTHAHDDDAPHTHDHVHTPELPQGVAPLSRRGLILIGLSGGILPSPSAFLVLTTALFSGRTLFGLALVAAFSVGLALTLALLGLAVLHGKSMALRHASSRPRLHAAFAWIPSISAVLITLGGMWLTAVAASAL